MRTHHAAAGQGSFNVAVVDTLGGWSQDNGSAGRRWATGRCAAAMLSSHEWVFLFSLLGGVALAALLFSASAAAVVTVTAALMH